MLHFYRFCLAATPTFNKVQVIEMRALTLLIFSRTRRDSARSLRPLPHTALVVALVISSMAWALACNPSDPYCDPATPCIGDNEICNYAYTRCEKKPDGGTDAGDAAPDVVPDTTARDTAPKPVAEASVP
jgi:hypothetical protein